MKESPKPLNEVKVAGPSVRYVEKDHPRPGKEIKSLKPKPIVRSKSVDVGVKPNSSSAIASVKAKKGVARNRAALSNRSSTVGEASAVGAPIPLNAQGKILIGDRNDNGKNFLGTDSQDRFAIGADFGVGFQFGGGVGGDQGACSSEYGRGQQGVDGFLDRHPHSNGEECDGRRLAAPKAGVDNNKEVLLGSHGGPVEGGRDERFGLECVDSENTNGVVSHAAVYVSRGEAAVRDGDLDRMELEGGDEATPAC